MAGDHVARAKLAICEISMLRVLHARCQLYAYPATGVHRYDALPANPKPWAQISEQQERMS